MSSNNMMPPNPPNPPISEEALEIGVRLREARIQAGLGLQDVASKLKMQVRIIEALEAGNWERLGAPVFVRGQLRSYVRLLGLPADLVPIATSQAPDSTAQKALATTWAATLPPPPMSECQ